MEEEGMSITVVGLMVIVAVAIAAVLVIRALRDGNNQGPGQTSNQ